MMLKKDDYVNFYYNSGIYLGDYLPNLPLSSRLKVVDRYKKFVDDNGGVESFANSRTAVSVFIKRLGATAKGASRVKR